MTAARLLWVSGTIALRGHVISLLGRVGKVGVGVEVVTQVLCRGG